MRHASCAQQSFRHTRLDIVYGLAEDFVYELRWVEAAMSQERRMNGIQKSSLSPKVQQMVDGWVKLDKVHVYVYIGHCS